ncbi:MAG TPA: Gfo/Idh/MocA family oxidoreductase [Bacteroidota bacterium]|nr:Gfo/Idh/MocA family oxidoreductase [Bacteroidota bacterium]
MTPLRVCVAGLVHGHVSGFMEAARRRNDIEIVGIAEADTALSGDYRKRYHLRDDQVYVSLESMLQKARPEAVAVFSTTFDHRAIVELCSRHGVHVMMEKPLAVSLADAGAIAKAAKEGNIAVLVNYETTWYRNTRDVYRIVHQNELGEIRKMIACDGHRGPREIGVGPEFLSWLTDPLLDGGGALMDFGCYGANLFTYLMDNQRPLTVTAVTQQLKPDLYPRVDDEATILLTYPHAQGIIQASWNWPSGRKDLEVFGAGASVSTVGRDRVRVRAGDGTEKEVASAPLESPGDDPLSYLSAVVRGGIRPAGLSSLENNLVVSEILEAARRSAASGRTIRLPIVPEEH